MIRVELFASLKEAAGLSSLQVSLANPATVAEVFDFVVSQYPELKRFHSTLLVAVNEEYAAWDTAVEPNDEVAFFPPVSGGFR